MWPASSQVSTKWERNITHCKLSRQTMMRAHLVMNLRIPGCPKGDGRGHVSCTKLQFSTPRHQGHMWALFHFVWRPVDYRVVRITLLYCLMARCNWPVPSNASRALFMLTLHTSVKKSASSRLPLLHALERAPNKSRGIHPRPPPSHSTTTGSVWHLFLSTMM